MMLKTTSPLNTKKKYALALHSIHISLVDTETGELLAAREIENFAPNAENSIHPLSRWIGAFCRGIGQGRCLHLEFENVITSF